MAKVAIENPPPPTNNQQPTQGAANENPNRPGVPNIFSLGFSLGQQPNFPNQRSPQTGNSVFIRAVSTNNNNGDLQNISQTFNNLFGNIIGPNSINPNNVNPNPNANTGTPAQQSSDPNQQANQTTPNNFQPPLINRPINIPNFQPLNINPNQNMSQPQQINGPHNMNVNMFNLPQGMNLPQRINIPLGNNMAQTPQGINMPQQGNTNQPQGNNMPHTHTHGINLPMFINQQQQNINNGLSPNQNILNMATLLNGIMGPQSQFPGPVLPRPNLSSNTVSNLGHYLYNYEFQLMRANPYLSRLSDLLIRETLIDNRQDRAQLQNFAHEMGHFLEELALATRPLVSLLKNLQLGDHPGNYRLVDVDNVGERVFDNNSQRLASTGYVLNNLINRPVISQTNPSQQNSTPLQPQANPREGTEISISISGIEIEENNANRSNVNINNNQNQNQQSQNNNNANGGNRSGLDVLNLLGNNLNLGGLLNNMLGGLTLNNNNNNNNNNNMMPNNINISSNSNNANNANTMNNRSPQQIIPVSENPIISQQNQPQNQPPQQNQPQPQSQLPPPLSQNINPLQQNQIPLEPPQMGINMNMMGGNMLQGIMDYTLKDLMMENYGNQLEGMDEEFLQIFGNLKIGEIVTAFISPFSFINPE